MARASTMHERLKEARQKAGYKTATAAIDAFGWSSSTYRAHENGQNGFKVDEAKLYGEAYRVSPSWLLLGEGDAIPSPKERKKIRSYDKEKIYPILRVLDISGDQWAILGPGKKIPQYSTP